MPLIGDRIRVARISAGYRSQGAFAEALEVSRGLVGQWESHKKSPGRDNLAKISKLCAISMEYLLGEMSEMRESITVSIEDEMELLVLYRRMPTLHKQNLLYIATVMADAHGVRGKKREKV